MKITETSVVGTEGEGYVAMTLQRFLEVET